MKKSKKFSGDADKVLLKMWKRLKDEEKIKYFFSYMNFHKRVLYEYINSENPDKDEKELKYLFFEALYGRDFTRKEKEKIKEIILK